MMLAMAPKRAGKNPNFTDEQNAVLREELMAFMQENDLNQPAMAKKLGIEQPSVGRYVQAKNPTGFAYPIATKIARLRGYIGVDALFATRGVALDAKAAEVDPTLHPTQADGMRSARAVRVSEKAIQLVNKRHDPGVFHTAMWWCTQYISQQEALDEARREVEPEPKAAPRSVRGKVANE